MSIFKKSQILLKKTIHFIHSASAFPILASVYYLYAAKLYQGGGHVQPIMLLLYIYSTLFLYKKYKLKTCIKRGGFVYKKQGCRIFGDNKYNNLLVHFFSTWLLP